MHYRGHCALQPLPYIILDPLCQLSDNLLLRCRALADAEGLGHIFKELLRRVEAAASTGIQAAAPAGPPTVLLSPSSMAYMRSLRSKCTGEKGGLHPSTGSGACWAPHAVHTVIWCNDIHALPANKLHRCAGWILAS